jgi:hypothetical protein
VAIADRYARAVWDADSLLATWTPDRRIAVGDVVSRASGGGVLVERKLFDLVDGELPPVTVTDAATSTLLQSGVTVEASADAGLPAGVARISLSGSRSFLFTGGSARLKSFETLAGLRNQLTALSVLGRWEPGWHLVTAVREHAASTVVIAESDAVQAEIRVEGSGVVESLAGITAGGRVSVTSGRAATYTMGRCTPFYEALRVRRRLSGSRVDEVTLGEDSEPQSAVIGDLDTLEVVRVSLEDVGLLD